jgi:Lar family restriction alleviation protein
MLWAKPCPFCGEESLEIHEGSTFRWVVAECLGCGARCGEVRVQTMGAGLPADWKGKAEKDVIEEWNKRAPNKPSLPARAEGEASE